VYCLTPPIESIPEEAFFCKECETKKEEERDKMEREARNRLIEIKSKALEDNKNREEEEESSDDNLPVDEEYEKFFDFIKKKEREATKLLIRDSKKDKQKEKDKEKGDKPKELLTPKKEKKDLNIKRVTPISKKRDEYYEVTKKAIDKFQTYLQKNQQFFQQLNNFNQKKNQKTQDEKKSIQLNKIQMQLILKSNFILF
jgi:hypothetical protein